jgi:transcriptional regulator with XRE-family HTH domain
MFPVIDPVATGQNILRLRKARGLSVRDLQEWFGFEEPQAIYKWQKGKSLPTVDNLYALGVLLDVPMDQILVTRKPKLNMINNGQQESSCCPSALPGSFECDRTTSPCHHFVRQPRCPAA